MNQNHFWNLLEKKFSGEAFAEATARLEDRVNLHPQQTFPGHHPANLRCAKTKDKSDKALRNCRPKLPVHKGNFAKEQKQRKRPKILSWIMISDAEVLLFSFGRSNAKTTKPPGQDAGIRTLNEKPAAKTSPARTNLISQNKTLEEITDKQVIITC